MNYFPHFPKILKGENDSDIIKDESKIPELNYYLLDRVKILKRIPV